MNRLRKIGAWIWRNKERILFGVLVVVLCFCVWKVVNPDPPPELSVDTRPPNSELPQDWEEGPPAPPASTPDPLPRAATDALLSDNPFTVHGGPSAPGAKPAAASKSAEEPEAEVTLVRISQGPGDSYRAELRINNRPRRVSQGDVVDGYRIERVDGRNNTVIVVSEESGKRTTLKAK